MSKYINLLAAVAGVASAIIAFIALQDQRTVEQAPEQEKQPSKLTGGMDLTQAWALINTRVPGTAGKAKALEFLHDNGESLSGIDLSCTTMGGKDNWKIPFEECRLPVRVQKVNLVKANLFEANFEGVDFALADLSGSDMTRASLRGANFASARLVNSRLIQADGRNGWFYNANLSGAELWGANFQGAFLQETKFDGANVSKSKFGENSQIKTASFVNIWAWRDEPPSGLDGVDIKFCDFISRTHDRMKRPKNC